MPTIVLIYFLVSVLGFGSAFALNNIAVTYFSFLAVSAIRALIATVAVWGYVDWSGVNFPMTRINFSIYLLLGVLTAAVRFSTQALGHKYITAVWPEL